MNTTHRRFDVGPNVGTLDRDLRFILGAVLIGLALFVAPRAEGPYALAALLAIPLIATGIMQWDPLYALLRLHTAVRHRIHYGFDLTPNLGYTARAVHAAVAAALIGLPIALSQPYLGWGSVWVLLSIPVGAVAVTGWSPLRALRRGMRPEPQAGAEVIGFPPAGGSEPAGPRLDKVA